MIHGSVAAFLSVVPIPRSLLVPSSGSLVIHLLFRNQFSVFSTSVAINRRSPAPTYARTTSAIQ